MRIDAKRLGMRDGIGEMIRQIVLLDGDRVELGAGLCRHLPGDWFLVILLPVETQGEGPYGAGMVLCCETKHRAGVQAAAQVTSNGNIGAKTNANRLLQTVSELVGPIGIGNEVGRRSSRRIIEIPVGSDLKMLFSHDQKVSGRNLEDTIK